MIVQQTLDNVQGSENLITLLRNLQSMLLKVNEMETEEASADVANFLEKLEVYVF